MRNPDRYFDPDPGVRAIARRLYERVAGLPLISPHGHVEPRILAEDAPFPDPAALLVVPDHYVLRMLYSQGVPLESLGVPRRDGGPIETDPREIWQRLAEKFYLFRGTPSGCWLRDELEGVFGIEEPLNAQTAAGIYERISRKLATPEFRPRALFERFRIEVLCTTDAATDPLDCHRQIRQSGWKGRVLPTFRPDAAVNLLAPGWQTEIEKLGKLSGKEVTSFRSFIEALEDRRAYFRSMGAVATDHGVVQPYTEELTSSEAEAIFARALAGSPTEQDGKRFTAHMLMEFARMSTDDGLVMQLHPGSWRNHNQAVFEAFGPDKGCDIPVATEYTENLRPLLNKYGNNSRFRMVLFTLDESTYSRELAPLAGHYPALRLGPPWWFHDSIQGMIRFRERVTETAGICNTAGFNDDTRAFLSIPARHDLARRVDSSFLSGLVARHIIEMEEAEEMAADLAYNLARETYRIGA
ncbi:MAG TPA: glucuronate isomerase [Bryobacteraceae bacterium]|nr:glucuronate isomerase [Bryobacteraceae bacterium]